MDARRGKKITTRNSAVPRSGAAVGKENVCPDDIREIAKANRSPLPEGFRRAPLQDITHILSPINAPLNDGDSTDLGLCKPLRKRSKCLVALDAPCSTSACESAPPSSDLEWRGLRKCNALEASVSVAHTEEVLSKHTEGEVLVVEERSVSEARIVEVARVEASGSNGRDRPETEEFQEIVQTVPKWVRGVDKKGEGEANSNLKSPGAFPTRPSNTSSSSSIRSSLRSAQTKYKMSSLMKLR